ncbi:palmitoyltransferase ZDHHC23-B-like isoform X4 [Tachypleus tridentatus]|uniref:palmitoyltransferase ZDHHC23-B-like isoform X4 n=1 Tax=Tachypleus tridentatus TaxID=6853 RepID=UPI003FD4B63D
MQKQNVLCCCEYVNNKGERSHLMGFCCDCEALDESFDRLITCKSVRLDSCSRIMDTVADRLRLPWCDGLNCCIGAKNHRYFIIGLFALIIACCYGANLTLTTICHPKLMWGTILLPDNCNDVYGDIHIAICFVSAIYALLIAALAFLVVCFQLWLICCNTTLQEWRKGYVHHNSQGYISNCWRFWCKQEL